MGIFREQKLSKSAKAKLDDLLARESSPLREQQIHKILASMQALVYGAEMVSTTKRRKFQVRLNRAQRAATTWSDADRQKAIEQLEREIDQVTSAKRKLFAKLFQNHERQLLQEVGTKATGPRSIFATELPLRNAAAHDEAYCAAIMTTNKQPRFQNHPSDSDTEATTWSLADPEPATNRLEGEIYGIT